MGEFMSYLPKTVITGLLASLFVALVINPTLCAAFMRVRPERRRAGVERPPSRFMRTYERLLAFSIDHHRASIVGVFAVLAVLVALYGALGKGLIFFPDIEPDRASVNIQAPRGTSLATTDALARRAETIARGGENVDFVIADVGTGGRSVFVGGGSSRADAARVSVNFREYERRTEKASATLARIRDGALRQIVGAEVEVAKEEHGPPTGAPVNVEVSGEDFETIVRLASRVTEEIKRIPGVVDLKDDYDPGQPEIRVLLDKERAALHGVSAAEVSGVIRAAVSGVEAGVFREGDEEYDITVRLPKAERRSLDALRHMTIPDRLGNQVPLGTFARLEIGEGLGSIRRKDNKRVVTVSGEVQGRLADEVRREARAAVARLALPPRTGIAFTGEYEEQEKNQAFLGKAFLVGVLLIALVLVTEFNSLRISFIILFTVVLSLMGVIIGLLVTRSPFGVIMTGIAVISLGGIVVNNAIVLLDFIENLRAGGVPIREALITAGKIRLRPVTLGAISTVVGLVPVALGIDIDFVNLRVVFGSESSQWWESLAVAIIFGASVATALTLVMVPTFYRAFFGLGKGREPAAEAAGGTDHA
jgi:multidrug efflux pump subunit AcrB